MSTTTFSDEFTNDSVSLPLKGFLRQQKSPDDDGDVSIIDEGERHREYSMIYHNGAVATADDPTAITTIQSAATFLSDQPIKYLFKTEGGGLPVTYRVIQVSDGQVDGQTDGASAVSVVTGFPATTQAVTQAVFSQSEGLEGEASETHYYYPVTDATQTTMVETVQAPETLLTQSTPTGQLYVMMSPQDVLGGANQSKSEPPRTSRDDKRRAQHNEVERRRRDKINNWIVQLSKTIPDCTLDATKNGQVSSQAHFYHILASISLLYLPHACRVKEGSCPRLVTTSRSCVRATPDWGRTWRIWRDYAWTTSCSDRRLMIGKPRTR
ncbi:upstream stimulatory factor 1 isoform X6 [Coregonus clupeaformis]|uniref:upstream stimulatory factor 1 isoform X6 n=1 Tax=Coregonus clupeaformis TaxID=59861 RepID=UPI001E1C2A7C|nr:upstream stimulatory factor 1 isoform X6 [Coregonus clupeaformis]